MKKKLVAATAVAAGAFTGFSYLLFNEVMNRDKKVAPKIAEIFNKNEAKKNAEKGIAPACDNGMDERAAWFNAQKKTEYTIVNDDGMKLKGYLIPAEKDSKVYVFCSHGYTSSGAGDFCCIAKFWHDKGYNVFLVDHRSHGESEGKWIGFGHYETKDCLKWFDFMINEFGDDIKIILHGISMGSATVIMLSGHPLLPSNVKLTVADCGYTSCENEFRYAVSGIAHLPCFPLLNVTELFNKVINGYSFKEPCPVEYVKNAHIPMLFLHGANDNFVPTAMCSELYNACSSYVKDMMLIENAGHAESYKVNPVAYEAKVTEFIQKAGVID